MTRTLGSKLRVWEEQQCSQLISYLSSPLILSWDITQFSLIRGKAFHCRYVFVLLDNFSFFLSFPTETPVILLLDPYHGSSFALSHLYHLITSTEHLRAAHQGMSSMGIIQFKPHSSARHQDFYMRKCVFSQLLFLFAFCQVSPNSRPVWILLHVYFSLWTFIHLYLMMSQFPLLAMVVTDPFISPHHTHIASLLNFLRITI